MIKLNRGLNLEILHTPAVHAMRWASIRESLRAIHECYRVKESSPPAGNQVHLFFVRGMLAYNFELVCVCTDVHCWQYNSVRRGISFHHTRPQHLYQCIHNADCRSVHCCCWRRSPSFVKVCIKCNSDHQYLKHKTLVLQKKLHMNEQRRQHFKQYSDVKLGKFKSRLSRHTQPWTCHSAGPRARPSSLARVPALRQV